MTRTLRGVCVGAGYFSQFHFDAWRRLPGVQIVAVCDRELERAASAVRQFPEAVACPDAAEALDRFRPDFIDIITPPASHYELVELAAQRRVAVICQKPLAPDYSTAQQIVALARHHQIPLMVHENFRFQPWHREIKRLLDAGAIGQKLHQLSFRSRPGDGSGPDAYLARQPYFRDMPRLLVHETGVHFIDTFRFLAGEIVEAHALLRRLNPVIRGEDAGLLLFRFASGATGVWDANRWNESNSDDPRYTFGEFLVEGDGGSLRLAADGRITLQPLGQPEREHTYRHEPRGFGGDCVYFTQQHFLDRLRAGGSFETNGEDYLKTLAVEETVYAAAAANRPLPVRHVIAEPSGASSAGPPHEPAGRRIVDLSLPLTNQLRGVQITPYTSIAGKGWNTTTLSLYSHCGTHMDAPKHFLDEPQAATIDQQRLEVCCGPAKVVDLTPIAPRESITVERLCRARPDIRAGDRLLLRTDWHHRLGTEAYRDELPRLSRELARWLVDQGVALVGVEPPSVADVNNKEELTEVHQTLFRGNVVIVEGLANLDQLQSAQVEFIALPLRIDQGDGSPVRAIAIERGAP